MKLTWLRSPERWARHVQLSGFTLLFKHVNFFRVKERDSAYPPTEDDCICNVAFHPTAARDEYDNIYLETSLNDDLTFFFQREWGIKINAGTAELIPLITAEL